MSFELLIKKLSKIWALMREWLSLQRDKNFIPNLVLCIGVVFVWRGVWNLVDAYFFPGDELLSNILSIVLGVFIIYLPDHSFEQLWWLEEELEDDIKKEAELVDELKKELKKHKKHKKEKKYSK